MTLLRVFTVAAAVLWAGFAAAQSFPAKPVKIVVPWPTGGGADYVARTFGNELSKVWGQPVIVENLAGAGSIVGASRVAQSPPDGYTLMLTINGTLVGNRFLYKQLAYDPDRSFVPVSLLVQSGQLILASSALPVSSMRELVEYAKREPEKVAYASYGLGTQPHLSFEIMNKRENIKMLHVPYKGLAPAISSVMGNDVQLTIVSPSSATAAIQSGRAKAIAIGSDTRGSTLPDVPTVAESGFPYMRSTIWFGLFAPAGTPSSIVDKIQGDIVRVTSNAGFSKGLSDRGFDVMASDGTKLSAMIKEEVGRTAEMVEAAGVKPE